MMIWMYTARKQLRLFKTRIIKLRPRPKQRIRQPSKDQHRQRNLRTHLGHALTKMELHLKR